MSVRRVFRESLRRIGWDVRRVDPLKSESAQLARQLLVHGIDVVFDVGASIGQFAEQLRHAGYPGRIVSFEASSAAHLKLTARARHDTNWIIAPRIALGDLKGRLPSISLVTACPVRCCRCCPRTSMRSRNRATSVPSPQSCARWIGQQWTLFPRTTIFF